MKVLIAGGHRSVPLGKGLASSCPGCVVGRLRKPMSLLRASVTSTDAPRRDLRSSMRFYTLVTLDS
jgi:hypothetical protein